MSEGAGRARLVNWAQKSAILCLGLLLGLSVDAQRKAGAVPARPNLQSGAPNTSRGGQHPGRKMGDWLREHRDLPLDQQEKLLQDDPAFKRLPPERQAKMLENLRRFNSLPPQQQQRVLDRMDFMANLTSEQREQIRQSQQALESLPPDRRVMIHKALRHLRQMDPQQRQEVLNSERFKSMFSEQERGILGQLSAINPPEGEGNPNPQQGGQPPK